MIRWLASALLLPALMAAAPLPAPPVAPSAAGRVTALHLSPGQGQAELTIQVEGGSIRYSDFALSDPARIVVDIQGAASELSSGRYDGIARGGISSLRASQYQPDVVRIVIETERPSRYTVTRVPEGLKVALASGATAFEPWSSGRAVAARAEATGRTPAAPAARAPRPMRPITVSFQEADIRDVLASFAEFTGRSIVPGSGVAGTVTAEIRNQPWDVALETILRANGLAARELSSGIIEVNSMEKLAEREAKEPLITQTIRVNYVPVGELVTTLAPLKTERGSILPNLATNTLIVTDVESVVNNVVSLVRQLDVTTPQVAIEAKIIFVDRTQAEALGIRYDIKDLRGNSFGTVVETPVRDPVTGRPTGEFTKEDLFLLGGPSIAAVGNAKSKIDNATLDVAVSLLLANRFSIIGLVSALQESRLADVQATPLITTLDNQPARIFVGEEITFLTAAQQGGIGGASTLQPVRVEAGIELKVVPHITADRRVRLNLSAENSNPLQTSAGLLNIQRQQGETQLIVADGETAVIGGLTVTRVVKTRAGIPLLMDIPYLGVLFRTENKEERKQDLLIMVTPHIVQERR
jgi:type IV pilus assembly protein PilQ